MGGIIMMGELICPYCGEEQEEMEATPNFMIDKLCEYCGRVFTYRILQIPGKSEIQYFD
jgi:uncharacterized Zn-finger protein